MNFWSRIWTAAANLVGPPALPDKDGRPCRIDPSGVTAALIALGAKMAKADGLVQGEEIVAFKRVFRTDMADELQIGRFFDLARQTTLGWDSYAAIVARKFRAQPAALEDVMDGLFHIALADGVVTEDEMDYLQSVSRVFGFSDREFERIRLGHMGGPASDPYLILGVYADTPDEDLKTAYRRMVAANHPDRLLARGLPREMIGIASEKTAIINAAYSQIKNARRL